ncbi:hypothetical protein QVD17_19589 [Tagetes erecta]|uniref:Uncharacterized protein n=1 Tax=Tagetes erecta TaxID=13708 RepID=A0AAD8NXC4_TARER|nr:hypothetical protein QVD17_19589 [Tagetes erecta]
MTKAIESEKIEYQRKKSESGSSEGKEVGKIEKEVDVCLGKDSTNVVDGNNARNKAYAQGKISMHIYVPKGSHVSEQVVDYEEKMSANPKQEEPESEFLGFRDPEFLKWQKEQKELGAAAA